MSVTLQSTAAMLLERAQPQQRTVLRRLTRLRRSIRLHLLVAGLCRTMALIVGLVAVSLIVDRWLRLDLSSRMVLGVERWSRSACSVGAGSSLRFGYV